MYWSLPTEDTDYEPQEASRTSKSRLMNDYAKDEKGTKCKNNYYQFVKGLGWKERTICLPAYATHRGTCPVLRRDILCGTAFENELVGMSK